jgi:hypothetical protein
MCSDNLATGFHFIMIMIILCIETELYKLYIKYQLPIYIPTLKFFMSQINLYRQ